MVIIMLVLIMGGAQPVFAYSTYGGNPPADLLSPFKNFINSINSVGTTAIRIGTPAPVVLPPAVQAGAQNAFQRFDAWLFGIVGFHISGFLAAILGIFSWILGVVKSVVDWLLGLLFH